MSARFSAVVALSAVFATASAQESTPLAGRLVRFFAPVIGLPASTSNLHRGTAELAGAARVPIGYEALAYEPDEPVPARSTLSTKDRTVGQVLDLITTYDPRYTWRENDGVIHLRPVTSLDDPRDTLNQPVASFVLEDARLSDALREVQFRLHPDWRNGGRVGSGPSPTRMGLRRFSVNETNTTILGVLDAIVKAHGSSSWQATYGDGSQSVPALRLSFSTFDGWGTTQ
jgi:hypothetical protein